MPRSWFVVLLALSAFVVFCIPFDPQLAPLALAARTTHTRISITGNSVLTHFSHCDQDTRSIAAMLGAETGQPVQDLSYPGQSLSTSVNLAAISLHNPAIRAVVLPVSVFSLMEWDTQPIRTYLALRVLNPALYAASLRERLASPHWFAGAETPVHEPFVFDGTQYPDYDGIKTAFMEPERAAMHCPESDGLNRRFVAANYYHQYIEFPFLPQNVQMLASLGGEARRLGKDLEVVILPVDYDLLEQLLPGRAAPLRARVGDVARSLADTGLGVSDLSALIPGEAFADRWCACGHLLQSGRMAFAVRTHDVLGQHLPSVAAQQ